MATAVTATDSLVCYCYEVTESSLRDMIDRGEVTTVDDVVRCSSAGGGCTACHCRIRRMLDGLPPRSLSLAACAACGSLAKLCRCEAA